MQARHFFARHFVMQRCGDATIKNARSLAQTLGEPMLVAEGSPSPRRAILVVAPRTFDGVNGWIAEWFWP